MVKRIVLMGQMKELQVIFVLSLKCFWIVEIFFIAVQCNEANFCCDSGIQGDKECHGRCIPEDWINDGVADCDNALDEGGSGRYFPW